MDGIVFFLLGGLLSLACLVETRQEASRDHTCADTSYSCNYWASNGFCHTYQSVKHQCRLSCKLCSSTSASSTTSFVESYDCLQNRHYNHLKSLIGNSCSSMDEQWYYLYHLVSSSVLSHCAKDAARYLRDYYRHHAPRSDCSCVIQNASLTHSVISNTFLQCMSSDENYRDIYDTTFYDSQSTHHVRMCLRHAEEWGKLAEIADNSCFVDLVQHFGRKLFVNHDERCSCQTTNGGSGQTTQVPHHQTSGDECMQYSQYQYLDNLLAHDTCISHYEVWGYLDQLTSYSPSCRIKVINRLQNAYGHYTQTPSNCTCGTNFDHLKMVHDSHGHWPYCSNESHYNGLTSKLISSDNQVCSSHHIVWQDLAQIPHYTNSNYHFCQKDAISHLADSVAQVQNLCRCVPVSDVTTTLPQTVTPSIAPTSPDIKMCSTTALTVGLVYGDVLKEGNFTCSDGSHALSEAAPMRLCNATDSSTWIKGQQVTSHCDSIPLYSAIASFAGPVYTHDGLAGVFLGCNSTHVSIASEDCTHGLSVFSIPRDSRDSYVHSAVNYFTLTW
ncbi:uncharacterized protein LOC110458129 [Mizuhopecten yessoensis]|uniref:ShKT domain-containing protein n=1 Tax=Mizuhopecten yessoensis TaxID=6573 RepID=A0A210Q796_MIZYE|nr:uncharacterized protein LOC110458129 [Mizuhopecten yessoensis]OWF44604.1 hypothetical protein KP79_PYT24705 [Mizuhopecten yessoensis]